MPKFKTLFVLFIVLITLQATYAQFPADGQYQSIPKPATPALPAHHGSINDTSVPSTMQLTRLSEYYAPWDWYPEIEYAKFQTWNADETAYKFRSAWVFDANSHALTRTMPSGSIYPSSWSNTDSDLIYGFREDGEIKTYTVSTDQLQTIATIPGYSIISLGPGEGNIDKHDKYVAFVGKKDLDLDIIVFDLQTKAIIHTESFTGAWGDHDRNPKYIDWVSVSQSGDYVGIMWNHNEATDTNPFTDQAGTDHYGIEIYNTTTMTFARRLAIYGNHGDFGYAADGEEVFVQSWGPNSGDKLNMYNLSDGAQVVLQTHDDFEGAGHISCRNIDRPGWAYVTFSTTANTGQMLAVKLDDSGIVEHFGHHFSSYSSGNTVPYGVASPSGKKMMFMSDFGAADGTSYIFQTTLAAPLPIEWVDPLRAFQQKGQISLKWTVAQQINNEKFDIERSSDGIHFETIQSINADGNLVVNKEFSALDTKPLDGVNYYRIKQIDFDGQYEYSNIAYVRFETGAVSIYPNPAHHEFHIQTEKNLLRQIEIYNNTGQLVKMLSQNNATVNIEGLPNGIYWVRITEDSEPFIEKLILE